MNPRATTANALSLVNLDGCMMWKSPVHDLIDANRVRSVGASRSADAPKCAIFALLLGR